MAVASTFNARSAEEAARRGFDRYLSPAGTTTDMGDAGFAPQTAAAIGFAPGEGAGALTASRLQHGTRRLRDAGLLPAWRSSTSPQAIRGSLRPILERPLAAFDHSLSGTAVRGFLGELSGQRVAVFVFKEGPLQGRLAPSFVPSAAQLAKWGF
jgi:hypothetical protein